jgi:hypothetical protein
MLSNKFFFVLLVSICFINLTIFVLQAYKPGSVIEKDEELVVDQWQKESIKSAAENRIVSILSDTLSGNKIQLSDQYVERPLDLFSPEYLRDEKNINRHDFKYIINPAEKICGDNQGEHLLLIAFVPISVGNFAGRQLIRQTWSNPLTIKNANMKLVFMLGNTVNSTLIKEVQFESELYDDIVQEDFVDAYKNLTLKTGFNLKQKF